MLDISVLLSFLSSSISYIDDTYDIHICWRPMLDNVQSEIRLGQSGIPHWTRPIWDPTLDGRKIRPMLD